MDTDTTFDKILDALLDVEKTFPPKFLNRFSDLSFIDAGALNKIWPFIPEKRKIAWLEDIEDTADTDTTTSFMEIGRLALKDPLPAVRELGIRLLWESEEHSLIRTFIQLVDHDPDTHVQAAAASALGRFIFLGEMEEISEMEQSKIEELLISKFNPEHPALLRRRAIESLGFSSNPVVDDLIKQAYNETDNSMRASALFAMGHSANDGWKDIVLSNLHHENQDIQLEAIRAAGGLELQDARDLLLDLLEEDSLDQELMLAIVWSLSQIGGEGVQHKLEELADDRDLDDDSLGLIDDALENLAFTNSLNEFGLLEVDEEEGDE